MEATVAKQEGAASGGDAAGREGAPADPVRVTTELEVGTTTPAENEAKTAAKARASATILGGAYQLHRRLAVGGMASVYQATQLRLGRRVAVKVMGRALASHEEAMARFRREAEVTSLIGHPHIVQVFDFGTAPSGAPYLVMEYLEGEDLERRLHRVGRIPPSSVVAIVKQASSALAAAHARGIVHRDLKPANVFLLELPGEPDFVKLVDFGISKARAAATRITDEASAIMGTPNYMAPEQASGRIEEVDHRTDQWALACLAWEMLSGRPPFVGDDISSVLYQVCHVEPAPLHAQVPTISAEVDAVLRRALTKDPARRYPTIVAFARAFEAAATEMGAAVAAAETRLSETHAAVSGTFSAAPRARRRRWPTLLLAALGGGVALLLTLTALDRFGVSARGSAASSARHVPELPAATASAAAAAPADVKVGAPEPAPVVRATETATPSAGAAPRVARPRPEMVRRPARPAPRAGHPASTPVGVDPWATP